MTSLQSLQTPDLLTHLQTLLQSLPPAQSALSIKSSPLQSVHPSNSPQEFLQTLCSLFLESSLKNRSLQFLHTLPCLLSPRLTSLFTPLFLQCSNPQIPTTPNNSVCYCQSPLLPSSPTIQCSSCSWLSHRPCSFPPSTHTTPECPLCFIQHMDPLMKVQEVIMFQQFKLTDKYFEYKVNLARGGGDNRGVEMRCIKVRGEDNSCFEPTAQICWPEGFDFVVNGVTQKVGRLAEGKYQQAFQIEEDDITRKTKLQIRRNKHARVRPSPPTTLYLFAIVLTERRTISELTDEILHAMPNETLYLCRLLSKFSSPSPLSPSLPPQLVPTLCPLTNTPLEIPVKGTLCLHEKCFNLQDFLFLNKEKKQYRCPIFGCGQRCHHLVVNPVMYGIVAMDYVLREYQYKVRGVKGERVGEVEMVEFGREGVKVVRKKIEWIVIEEEEKEEGKGEGK